MRVLEANNLNKMYLREQPLYKQLLLPFAGKQWVQALDSVSIGIESGQIFGVIGPNGAGKTTLLKILADVLDADGGTIVLCGQVRNGKNYKIRGKIGYVPSDERSFFWRLTGRENLLFFASLYGLSSRQAKHKARAIINQFSFEKKADHLFRDYSAGMRKIVSVMRALLHEPPLLLLDEVTNSLDPGMTNCVKEMVRLYISEHRGRAAVWSTHRLEEISQICDRVLTIDSGKVVSDSITKKLYDINSYILKVKNLNGRLEAFCKMLDCKIKIHKYRDMTHEFQLSEIDQKQFSHIVSMVVRDFGASIIHAGLENNTPGNLFDGYEFNGNSF